MDTQASAKNMSLIDMTHDEDDDDKVPPQPLKRLASYHGQPAQDARKKARIGMLLEEVHRERRELAEAALPHLEAIRTHVAALLQIPRVRELEPYGSLRQQIEEYPGEPPVGAGFEDIAETVEAACDDARRNLLAGVARKPQEPQHDEDLLDVDFGEPNYFDDDDTDDAC